MLLRLLLGIVKGVVLGGLVGYGLAAIGFFAPGAVIAYLAAAVVGALIALIAGKPIWQKDSRIEVGMKAVAGAVLAPLLLLAVRHWLTMELPLDVAALLPGLDAAQGQTLTLGGFAVSSLALVAAVVGGFFDADNEPAEKDAEKSKAEPKQRIAGAEADAPDEQLAAEHEAAEVEAGQRRRRS